MRPTAGRCAWPSATTGAGSGLSNCKLHVAWDSGVEQILSHLSGWSTTRGKGGGVERQRKLANRQ